MAAGPIGSAYLYRQKKAQQAAAPAASYVPGFTPSLQTTAPVAATRVPASSVGLGAQTTQPVATTTAPSLSSLGIPEGVDPLQWVNEQWMKNPFSPVFNTRLDYNAYDPATAEYMRGLNDYATSLGVTDYNVLNLYPGVEKKRPSQNAQISLLPEYGLVKPSQYALPPGLSLPPETYSPTEYAARLKSAVEGKTPYEQMVEYKLGVPINYGLSGKDVNPYQSFSVRYNTPVALVDDKGKVIASGVGIEAAKKIADQAYDLSRGKKAYTLATADPATGKWTTAVTDAPNKSVLGQIANIALPALGAVLLPGVGGLAGALGSAGAAGAGAAAGSALSGVLQGKGIGDILKNAAIAGGATFAGGSLLGGAGGGGAGAVTTPGAAAGSTAGSTAGAATGALAGEAAPIVVEGIRQGLTPALGGLLSGSAGALSNWNALTGGAPAPAQVPAPEQPGITVVGQPGATVPGAGAVTGALTGAITPPSTSANIPEATGEPITVEATKPPVVAPVGALTGAVTGAVTPPPVSPSAPELVGEPITVEATKPPTAGATAGSLIGGTSLLTPGQNAVVDQALQGETTPEAKSDLQKVIDYLRLGGLGIGLIGDLLGGKGGSTSPGVMPGGAGTLSPVFSGSLPAANLPAATQRPATALPQTTQDWYRYGYGPEQSFFSNVPQGAPNTSTAYTGYAEGGSTGLGQHSRHSFAVGGPGDGRDDKIPAVLSDGEYVMDAETVAMLGNGSSKAGAEALDKFRVNIRKHKGRGLAKGKFSANAKKPEHYLKGRK